MGRTNPLWEPQGPLHSLRPPMPHPRQGCARPQPRSQEMQAPCSPAARLSGADHVPHPVSTSQGAGLPSVSVDSPSAGGGIPDSPVGARPPATLGTDPSSHTTPKCGHANYLKTCPSFSVPLCLCLPLPLLFQNHLKLLQMLGGLKALPPNRTVSLRDRSTPLHLKISHNFQLSLLAPACENAQIVPKCLS